MARLCLLLLGLQVLAPGGSTEGEHGGHRPRPEHTGPPTHHWTYGEQKEWDADYPDCGGEAQSPININTSSTTYDPALQPIVLQGYNLPAEQSLRLNNNGHTVVLQLPKELSIVGGLPLEYRAAQLHFHWGSPKRPGSEHTVNGEHYPGEIHMVFFSSEYSSIKEAMDKPGGLAVLGGFIEAGSEENPYYAHLLQYFDKVENEGEDTQVEGFDISGLLPTRMDRYYRYNGSLTTPPCFQTVNWTIFNDTIKVSPEQLLILEDTLHGDDHEILHLNFREPQRLNGRPVLASFRRPVGGRRGPGSGHADTGSSPLSPAPGSGPSDGEPDIHPSIPPDAASGPLPVSPPDGGARTERSTSGQHPEEAPGEDHPEDAMGEKHPGENTGADLTEEGPGGSHTNNTAGGAHPRQRTDGDHPDGGTDGDHPDDSTGGVHPEEGTGEDHPEDNTGGDHQEEGTSEDHPEDNTGGDHQEEGNGEVHPEESAGGDPAVDGTDGDPAVDGTGGDPAVDGTGGDPAVDGTGGDPAVDGTNGDHEEEGIGGDHQENVVGGLHPEEGIDGVPSVEDAGETPGSRNSAPDSGDAEHLKRSSLGTGDMLAIIFGVLFAVTAVAFFIYVRKQPSKNRRMNSEDKPNVIYKAATTEENIA
ncbi:uncharacterized protein LOC144817673 [Lissotriton helveticus]